MPNKLTEPQLNTLLAVGRLTGKPGHANAFGHGLNRGVLFRLTTAEIESLLERVRRATGPDRKIDESFLLVEGYRLASTFAPDRLYVRGDDEDCFFSREAPRVTASIDAALALIERVLPGWAIAHIGEDYTSPPKHTIGWTVELEEADGPTFQGQASTLPLALIEALLLALLHQASDKGTENADA